MKHYMVDLETMGLAERSAIVSIGIVEFDRTQVLRKFYNNISLADCVKRGLTMDPSTVMWWIQQASQARAALMVNPAPLVMALTDVSRFLLDGCPMSAVRIWGNGANFDNVLLKNAYRAVDADAPWMYYNDRCFRTMKQLFPLTPGDQPSRQGTHHNALDDAVYQTEWLLKIFALYPDVTLI